MKILAIETTTEVCSAALMINNFIFDRLVISPGKHTKYILPIINDLLTKNNLFVEDLNLIVFSGGPGSFTGIRIGMGIAKGIALGANLKLVKISTLKILAQQAWQNTGISKVLTAINASKNQIYFAKYIFIKNNWVNPNYCIKLIKSEDLITLVNNLKGKWIYAGSSWYSDIIYNHITSIFFNKKKILFPLAKYMLPIALNIFSN